MRSAREAARAELQKVSLSLLDGGVPLTTSDLRAGSANAEFERTGGAVPEVATRLTALVAALMKSRADAEVARRRLVSTCQMTVAVGGLGGLVGLIPIIFFVINLGVPDNVSVFIAMSLVFGYLIVWLGLMG